MMFDNSEIWLCNFGTLVSIILRCVTSLHPYSGQHNPPMFGDYEAQRHWMEITVNLPLQEWYRNTTNNDLQYWGLDYPPLTAYHSYICGITASFINPDYVALYKSRGFESEEHKLFMRYTVLLADILVYIPSVILYFILTRKVYKKVELGVRKTAETSNISFGVSFSIILSLFYPGIILIDHGHFQYNCVSLGFLIYAISFICIHNYTLGSIFFCLALNYKQMELYHALPFFVYLLSTCVPKPGQSAFTGIKRLCHIAFTVLLTFFIIWVPFLTRKDDTLQVLHRLFPVARGIFEDKVANVWCALNVLYKFKIAYTNEDMFRYCTITTFVAVLPSCVDLFLRPNVKKFVPALINCALAFFLFSFQVHEKSILLASIPAMLYLQIEPIPCIWFLLMSVFSMLPLLIKDALVVAVFALVLFYFTIFHIIWDYSCKYSPKDHISIIPRLKDLIKITVDIQSSNNATSLYKSLRKNKLTLYSFFRFLVICFSFISCGILLLTILIFEPPANYPDIFPLLISIVSCFHFLGFFIYFNIVQFRIPQAIEDIRYVKLKTQ